LGSIAVNSSSQGSNHMYNITFDQKDPRNETPHPVEFQNVTFNKINPEQEPTC